MAIFAISYRAWPVVLRKFSLKSLKQFDLSSPVWIGTAAAIQGAKPASILKGPDQMYDNGTYRPRTSGFRSAGTVDRVRAWLAARPTECWGFFAAGFVLAVILT